MEKRVIEVTGEQLSTEEVRPQEWFLLSAEEELGYDNFKLEPCQQTSTTPLAWSHPSARECPATALPSLWGCPGAEGSCSRHVSCRDSLLCSTWAGRGVLHLRCALSVLLIKQLLVAAACLSVF